MEIDFFFKWTYANVFIINLFIIAICIYNLKNGQVLDDNEYADNQIYKPILSNIKF